MSKLSPVSYKQLVKVFEAEGFHHVRTEGDHMVFTKSGVIRPASPASAIPNCLVADRHSHSQKSNVHYHSHIDFKAQKLLRRARSWDLRLYEGMRILLDERVNPQLRLAFLVDEVKIVPHLDWRSHFDVFVTLDLGER